MLNDDLHANGGASRLVRRACAALAVAGMAIAGALPASAQSLVTNGKFAITGGTSGFEVAGYAAYTGVESLASWTPSASFQYGVQGALFDFVNGSTSAIEQPPSQGAAAQPILPTAISAPVGSNFIGVDANWGGLTTYSISQVISGLTVGATYALSFSWGLAVWTGYTGTDTGSWTATFGSSSQTTSTDTVVATNGGTNFGGWTTATFNYVATSASQTLTFLSNGTGQPPITLLANVSLTKAPEPMSMVLLGTGVIGLAGVARRRRASTASA